tara:strand:+ start:1842 stop:2171 length:330 start_codon:yes stop_codon:yes gene_type:complete
MLIDPKLRKKNLKETQEIVELFKSGVHEGNIIGISEQIDNVFDFLKEEFGRTNIRHYRVYDTLVVLGLFSNRIHGKQQDIKWYISPVIESSLFWLDGEIEKIGDIKNEE